MRTVGDRDIIAHVRRLATDGAELYIRIDKTDVARLNLRHGQEVEIDVGGKVRVMGIVRISGSVPSLAPGAQHKRRDHDQVAASWL
jgi:hypothetical protein